ncbi:MAG: glucosidase, partial [Hymenobacter sp.]
MFDDNRYFDVFVEYAKASPEDVLLQITVHNRGGRKATVQVLPQLWFRNTWGWGHDDYRPAMQQVAPGVAQAEHQAMGQYYFYCEHEPQLLFCENDSNGPRLYGLPGEGRYFKDGINDYVVEGRSYAINPEQRGTKVAAQYELKIPAGQSRT